MRLRRLGISVSILLLAFAQLAFADIESDWTEGQQAFLDGDYGQALLAFQSARSAGLDTPAVHYNIAVCQFKLGDLDAAAMSFGIVAERFPQMRGLAEYNLGLVDRRLGNVTAMRQHFLRAYELSPEDEKLRILSSRMLRETEPVTTTAPAWSGAAGLRVGHDDNVALRDELGLPAGVTAASPMTDIFASVEGPLSGRGGIRLDGSAYLIRYFDADEFDQSEIRGGLSYDWRPDDWRIDIGVHASAGTLGGDAFDQKTGASARVIRYLGSTASLDFRYTYDNVRDRDAVFAGISGSRQQYDARYRWYSAGHRVVLRYLAETNDRDDAGVSPSRRRVALDYRYGPEAGWGYEAGAEFRRAEYDDLLVPRDEELLTVRAALTWALPGNWLALLDYRYSENDSSDETYSYDRSQVTLGILKTF